MQNTECVNVKIDGTYAHSYHCVAWCKARWKRKSISSPHRFYLFCATKESVPIIIPNDINWLVCMVRGGSQVRIEAHPYETVHVHYGNKSDSLPSASVFLCQCHLTDDADSSSYWCCSYEDKRAKQRNLQKNQCSWVYRGTLNKKDLFQITNLTHNSILLQQYICYIIIFNMFRAVLCSSSGGQVVLLQQLVSSLSKRPYSMQVESGLSQLSTGRLQRVTILDAVII